MQAVKQSLKRFLEGRVYIALVMLLIFLGNTLSLDVPCALLLALMAISGFLLCDDLRFLIPPLCGFICIIPISHTPYIPTESDFYTTGALPYIIAVGSALLIVSLVFFIWRKRRDITPPAFRSSLLGGFILFAVALVLNGLFEPENKLRGLLYGLLLALSLFGVYLLFSLFHPRTEQNAEHFLLSMAALGVTVTAELLVLYATRVRFEGFVPIKNDIMIGWGTWTQIGALLTVSLPCALSFARKKKSWLLSMAGGAFIFLGIFLTASRGAWLYGGVLLLLSLLYLCFVGEAKKRTRVLCLVLLGAGLLVGVLLFDRLLSYLLAFMQVGFSDNGRFENWGKAWVAFLRAPIFGTGFLNAGLSLGGFPEIMPYLYHNTLLQMLASSGIYGFVFYLFHRVETLRLAWRQRKSPVCVFLLLSAAALVLVSLTDEHIFHIYPAFWYAIALSLAEGKYEKETP